MSDIVLVRGVEGFTRVKRKLISQTRKWGDDVDVTFEADRKAVLTVICEPILEAGEQEKSGVGVLWEAAPPGQYTFIVQATSAGDVEVTVDVHGVATKLKCPGMEAGEKRIAFEIEATLHTPSKKKSDNYALFRHYGKTTIASIIA